jgi:hypothetical protein
MTRLGTPGRFISSTRRRSLGSMYGPFFSDLDTSIPPSIQKLAFETKTNFR